MHLRLFQRYVRDQCLAAISAGQEMDALRQERATEWFWPACSSFLAAAGNISKACWGSSDAIALRRTPLRASLKIGDDSPLRSRRMRNNFEHLDERIDTWWDQSPDHNYVDNIIAPRSQLFDGEMDERNMFRVFDTETLDLWFWGQRYPTKLIAEELSRLYPIAQREADRPHA